MYSDEGTIVVGSGTTSANNAALRWTQSGLTRLSASNLYTHSSGVSADGSVAVGWTWNQSTTQVEAFRWTETTGAVGIGDLAGGRFESYANDVSADGSVVIGLGHTASGFQASRWTQPTGQRELLAELLLLELEIRKNNAESLAIEHYQNVFPDHADVISAVFAWFTGGESGSAAGGS